MTPVLSNAGFSGNAYPIASANIPGEGLLDRNYRSFSGIFCRGVL